MRTTFVFTLSGNADTVGVSELSPDVFVNLLATGVINVAGIGTADLVGAVSFFVKQNVLVAGFVGMRGDVLDVSASGFGSYDDTFPLGPLSAATHVIGLESYQAHQMVFLVVKAVLERLRLDRHAAF